MKSEADKIMKEFQNKIDEDGLSRMFPKNKNIDGTKISVTRDNSNNNSPLIKKNFRNDTKLTSEEILLNELKPVKFDGLYKVDMNPEKIEIEIEKFTKEEPLSPKPKKETRKNIINDNAYPFKQDIKCIIF
jgi:hypothetical protein